MVVQHIGAYIVMGACFYMVHVLPQALCLASQRAPPRPGRSAGGRAVQRAGRPAGGSFRGRSFRAAQQLCFLMRVREWVRALPWMFVVS